MIENKTTSDCTIYAFVGTAILGFSNSSKLSINFAIRF